ncbi:MAG: 2-alkenal reductase [Verrucomicrobiales bacterium]|nr:2-alkenal reductase [Verrucomicrobiales bacterium]
MKRWIWCCIAGVYAGVFGAAGTEVEVRKDATVQAVEKVVHSVVNIGTETIVQVRDPYSDLVEQFFGHRRQSRSMSQFSLGSGVIIDEDGYILTNDHVISRANKVEVTIETNKYIAEVVATSQATEVALLRIHKKGSEKFHAISLAKDDDLFLGETVVALGNPFGLGGSVSRGILSSKNRRNSSGKEALQPEDWLQTDAAINPGNSGGPLINLNGELIGLNVAVYREQNAQGIGFAIPIRKVNETLSQIFTPEGVKALRFGAKVHPSKPLRIYQVESGSPADKAGLKVNDTVLQVGEVIPRNYLQFMETLLAQPLPVSLTVQRSDGRHNLKVSLTPLGLPFQQKLGLTVQEMDQDFANSLGLNSPEGLVIMQVEKKSPAAEAEIRPGFIILTLDRQVVRELGGGATLLESKKRGDKVVLGIIAPERRGNLITYRQGNLALQTR